MRLSFHTLDVFTESRFGGNPLAVVHDADGLDERQMRQIAREFNLSETVFVLKPQNQAHSARIRIFRPATELPFAGHPTVGTAALLAELRGPAGGDRRAIVVLEETIGTVRVGVRFRDGATPFAEFDAPRRPEEVAVTLPPVERMAAALGLIPAEIGFENHRPTAYTAGVPYVFVPVASMPAIRKAGVQPQHWNDAFSGAVPGSVYLYCRDTVHTTSSFHARMFAPHHGVAEDPATGSAAAAFAGVFHHYDGLTDGEHRRSVEQGFVMGRPSIIQLYLEVARGRLHTVRIGGHAVRVSEGTLEV